jgi:dolichol-phosphate mannosyltransferase
VLRGLTEATGEIRVCLDADLSHPFKTLQADNVEFVIGSWYIGGGTTDEEWGWFRKLNSKVAKLLAQPFCWANDPLASYFGGGS